MYLSILLLIISLTVINYYLTGFIYGFSKHAESEKQLIIFWTVPLSAWIIKIKTIIKNDFKKFNEKTLYED